MHSFNPQPTPQEKRTPVDPVTAHLDSWTLQQWKDSQAGILHAIRNYLMSEVGFSEDQKPTAENLRDQIVPAVRDGYAVVDRLNQVDDIETLADQERRSLLDRLITVRNTLTAALTELITNHSGGRGSVKTNYLINELEVLPSGQPVESEDIDLIVEAQSFLGNTINWSGDPKEHELNIHAPSRYVQSVISDAVNGINSSVSRVSFKTIAELFQTIREDDSFSETFATNQERIDDMVVARPRITCTLADPQTLLYAVALEPFMISGWREELENLNQDLSPTHAVAAVCGLKLETSFNEFESQVELRLSALQPLPDLNNRALHRQGYITDFSPYTDAVTFPSKIKSAEGAVREYSVSTQRTAMMSAPAFTMLHDALEAAADFISIAKREWSGVSCAASCSVTLNEDAFQEGFFEVTLTGTRPHTPAMSEEYLKILYTFPWEKKKESALDFHNIWNAPSAPKIDCIKIPANALMDDHVRLQLARVAGAFGTVDLNFGGKGDFWDLYNPTERVRVISHLLDQIVEQLPLESFGNSYSFECNQSASEWSFDIGKKSELFILRIFDEKGDLVHTGALSSTTFKITMRPHSNDLERLAMTRLQAAIDKSEEGKPILPLLSEVLLTIDAAQARRILPDPTSLAPSVMACMQAICRDPWNTLAVNGEQLVIQDGGHPQRPRMNISYGLHSGRETVPIFRFARELHRIQEMGKNNGYRFDPTPEFLERIQSGREEPLEIE